MAWVEQHTIVCVKIHEAVRALIPDHGESELARDERIAAGNITAADRTHWRDQAAQRASMMALGGFSYHTSFDTAANLAGMNVVDLKRVLAEITNMTDDDVDERLRAEALAHGKRQ